MRRHLTSITLAAGALLAGALASSAAVGDDAAEPAAEATVKDLDARRDLTSPADLPTTQDTVYEDGVSRTWGVNRYATAAAIAEAYGWTAENTTSVYIATGESYPDALALGPSVLGDGPLLLVKRDSIPSQTRTSLETLQPCYIHAVGGETVISDAIFQELKGYADPDLCSDDTP